MHLPPYISLYFIESQVRDDAFHFMHASICVKVLLESYTDMIFHWIRDKYLRQPILLTSVLTNIHDANMIYRLILSALFKCKAFLSFISKITLHFKAESACIFLHDSQLDILFVQSFHAWIILNTKSHTVRTRALFFFEWYHSASWDCDHFRS